MLLAVSGSSLACSLQDPSNMLPGFSSLVGGEKAKWLFSQQSLDKRGATGPTNADGNIFPCFLSLGLRVL